MVGLTAILREAWTTSQQAQDKREKIQALSLAKECYSMKLELLTNATVANTRFVLSSQKSKDKGNAKSSSDNDKEKSKEEPDYGEDEDQLQEEQ
jgi:hypothetical protein